MDILFSEDSKRGHLEHSRTPFSLLPCRNRVRCVPQNKAFWQAGRCAAPKAEGGFLPSLKATRVVCLPLSHPYELSLTLLCPFLSHLPCFRKHHCIPPSFHPSLGMCASVVWTRPLFSGFIFPLMQIRDSEGPNPWALLYVSSCTKIQAVCP